MSSVRSNDLAAEGSDAPTAEDLRPFSDPIKALLIDPVARTVTLVEIPIVVEVVGQEEYGHNVFNVLARACKETIASLMGVPYDEESSELWEAVCVNTCRQREQVWITADASLTSGQPEVDLSEVVPNIVQNQPTIVDSDDPQDLFNCGPWRGRVVVYNANRYTSFEKPIRFLVDESLTPEELAMLQSKVRWGAPNAEAARQRGRTPRYVPPGDIPGTPEYAAKIEFFQRFAEEVRRQEADGSNDVGSSV